MKKIFILAGGVVVGVVLVLILQTKPDAVRGVENGLCIEGFNYQTDLTLKQFRTSEAGPLVAVYKNGAEYFSLYPYPGLKPESNARQIRTVTKTGWKVYDGGPAGGSNYRTYTVMATPYPFLVFMTESGSAAEKDLNDFFDTLTPMKCPSPNPGLEERAVAEKQQAQAREVAACEGVKISISEATCKKFTRESAVTPGESYTAYEATALIKNEGTVALDKFLVSVKRDGGGAVTSFQDAVLNPGAMYRLEPAFATDASVSIEVIADKNDEICFKKRVEAPISCQGL